MAKTKQQKEAVLARVRDEVGSAASAVFVHFTGIPVADEQKLRSQLKQEGISYFVAKKTILRKALGETAVEGTLPALDGEMAIAYNGADGDPTAPARSVFAVGKTLGDERFSIAGGIFENSFKDKAAMMEIATIPPIQVLYGMFANVINSPIQGLVIALNGIAEKREA
ncbi:MAG TPA: 50S ribosomal protein L10 [Candidatus Paceibacterota bacterium]|nr:50S ribosomal protein L10 [Candidatus Paceibacterota bacterium]